MVLVQPILFPKRSGWELQRSTPSCRWGCLQLDVMKYSCGWIWSTRIFDCFARTSRSFLLRLKNCCGFLGTRTAEHFTLANIPLPRVSKLAINQNCRVYLLFSTVRTDGESMRWVILSLGSAARIICLRDNTPSMCISNSWKKRNWEP